MDSIEKYVGDVSSPGDSSAVLWSGLLCFHLQILTWCYLKWQVRYERAFETYKRPYCRHKGYVFCEGEAKLKEIYPVPWVLHRNLSVFRCWQGHWLYKVILHVCAPESQVKSQAPKVKDSRNPNGDILPNSAKASVTGKDTPWVGELAYFNQTVPPLISAWRSAPVWKSWSGLFARRSSSTRSLSLILQELPET